MRDGIKQLPWKIIIILALVQFIRPTLSTIGAFDNFRAGPLLVTAVVTAVWIAVAVARVREPVKVLAVAGAVYAAASVLVAAFLQTFFTWSPEATVPVPLLLTVGLVASAIYNAAWGALLGLAATGIRRIMDRRSDGRKKR